MTVKQSYKNGFYDDCDATTNWTPYKTIFLQAGGYVSCIAGDVGKMVTDDAANLGLLASYDNATRMWLVQTIVDVTVGSVMAITAGTGAGTSSAGLSTTFTCDGDIINLTGTPGNTNNEYAFIRKDISNISTDTYPIALIKWRTNTSSNGMQALITFNYTAGTKQVTLGFSTNMNWQVNKITLDASKTLDSIDLTMDDNPDSLVAGTSSVYIDWIIVCAGIFTYPHVAPGDIHLHFPKKKAQIPIFGRNGDILQDGKLGSPTITINGNVLPGETWRASTSDPHFDYFIRGLLTDTVSYFSCDQPGIRGLVMYDDFEPIMHTSGNEADLRWQLAFTLYKLGDFSNFADWGWMYNEESGF